MATSFYELSVPTFLQTVRAVAAFLDRACRHCAETGTDPDKFVEVRLRDDRAPFLFEMEAVWHLAVWGLGAESPGVFGPPGWVGRAPFVGLQARMAKGKMVLEAYA